MTGGHHTCCNGRMDKVELLACGWLATYAGPEISPKSLRCAFVQTCWYIWYLICKKELQWHWSFRWLGSLVSTFSPMSPSLPACDSTYRLNAHLQALPGSCTEEWKPTPKIPLYSGTPNFLLQKQDLRIKKHHFVDLLRTLYRPLEKDEIFPT